MPELHKFLSGFGIRRGMMLTGYSLENISGQEVTIVHDRQYQYPIALTFRYAPPSSPQYRRDADPQALLSALQQMTAGERIITSSFGNPYACDFGTPRLLSEDRYMVQIVTTGHSHRIPKRR